MYPFVENIIRKVCLLDMEYYIRVGVGLGVVCFRQGTMRKSEL